MAIKHECRILSDTNHIRLEMEINRFLATGWAVTHMSTATATDTSGDYPQIMHYATVVVERLMQDEGRNAGQTIRHKDGDPHNNAVGNLEVVPATDE